MKGKTMSIRAGSNTGTRGMQVGGQRKGRACAEDPLNVAVAVVIAVVANIAPARNLAVRRMADLEGVDIDAVETVLVFMGVLLGFVPLFAAFLTRESVPIQKADPF